MYAFGNLSNQSPKKTHNTLILIQSTNIYRLFGISVRVACHSDGNITLFSLSFILTVTTRWKMTDNMPDMSQHCLDLLILFTYLVTERIKQEFSFW